MNRIKTIVSLIEPTNTLLDIGTDHGHVIIEAFKSSKIEKAIAVDINQGPLDNAYLNIKNENLHSKTTFLKTDGFLDVNEDYDGVIITGLGFKTIENILKMPHKIPNYYILGAQSEITELRKFLSKNNFKITDEIIYYNKKNYIFIKVKKGNQKLSYEEQLLGPILMNNKNSIKYYENKLTNLNKIYKIKNKTNNRNIKKQIKIYEKVLLKLVNS